MQGSRLRIEQVAIGALFGFLALCSFLTGASAQDAYKLRPGDVVSFSVAPIPGLNKELTVSSEGDVNVPLVGWTKAGGLTVREVEEEVRKALPNAVYRQRVNGDELLIVIRADEVALEVSKYRPIYVSGEVSSPGEKTYRPDITVRQAIALAGGPAPSAANASDEQLRRLADLKSQYGSLMATYVAALADYARLKTEISGEQTVVEPVGPTSDLAPEVVKSITDEAQQRVEAQKQLTEGERTYLQQAIQQNAQRVAVLREQQRQEQEGVDDDTAELNRIQTLAQQGSVQQTRVTEARRQLLLSSTRALETKAELATAELRQADLVRQLERLDETKKVADLSDVQTANREVERLHAELQGTADAIAFSTPVVTGSGSMPALSFTIYREGSSPVAGNVNDLEAKLQPGDVVEVYGVVLPSAARGTDAL
jgi:polysaccharide export outer membrane protein